MEQNAAAEGAEAPRQKAALISVSEKKGIAEVARHLEEEGHRILSTGGTLKHLRENGIKAEDVADVTGFPSIMDGRLKTIHPAVHGGMLAILNNPKHLEDLERVKGVVIDVVIIDLYPLEAEMEREGATPESIIEQTDIGGPAMLRSAAKGRRVVICDRNDYERILNWHKMDGPLTELTTQRLCGKAEARVAQYAAISASAISEGGYSGAVYEKTALQPAYSENRWQGEATLARPFQVNSDGSEDKTLAVDNFKQIAGNPPGYVNITDADSALGILTDIENYFDRHFAIQPFICIAVKHGNPCGIGVHANYKTAIEKMIDGDREAIHGATVVINARLYSEHANLLRQYGMKQRRGGKLNQRMLDAVWCAGFEEGSAEILERKTGRCRMMENPNLTVRSKYNYPDKDHPRIRGLRYGRLLLQGSYENEFHLDDPRITRIGRPLSKQRISDMLIAIAACRWTVSNTITLVNNGQLIGIGAGQTSRKRAAKLAVSIARETGNKELLAGAVAASDSFFPFPDGPQILIKAGIGAVFTTSGSINDESVAKLFQQHRCKLVWGPDVDFRMFCRH